MEPMEELVETLERWRGSYENKARVHAEAGAYTDAVRYNHKAITLEEVVIEARAILAKHRTSV